MNSYVLSFVVVVISILTAVSVVKFMKANSCNEKLRAFIVGRKAVV